MSRRPSWLGFPEQRAAWRKLLPYALLLSVTFLVYRTALYFDFVWDDAIYLQTNYRVQGWSFPRLQAIWTHSYLGHYAPMQHTVLAILYSVSGLQPFGYHLAQLLLHAACLCLLYLLLCKIESQRIALLASLLFAVFPPNIETVAWISEIKSTLALLFFLLSFLFFLRLRERGRLRDGALCGLFLILSLLSKINTIVAPAIFLLWDYRQGNLLKKDRLGSLGAFFLISAIFVGIHLSSFNASAQVLEGSTYYGGLGVHLMNLPWLILFYLRMAVFPHPLSAWHMAVVYPTWNGIVGIAWIGMLGLVWLLYRSSRTVQFWGLWFVVFLAPVLQIIPFGIWVADRYLYIPAIGSFVLLSKGFFWVADRTTTLWQRVGWEAAMAAILLAFSWHTHRHLPVWKNDLTLWQATTPTCRASAYCHVNLGLALLANGQTERGVTELIQAVELRPSPRYLIRLADVYTTVLQDYRQALIAYQMALEQRGTEINADFYAKLARLYIRMENWEEARGALQAGAKLNADDPNLLVVEAFYNWKQGNLEIARQVLGRAVAITGQRSNVLGFIYYYWGDAAAAAKLLEDLRTAPESRP